MSVTLSEKYNNALKSYLVEEFGMTPARAELLLNGIATFILNCLVFKGSVNTPFGVLSLTKDGVVVTGQNLALLETLKKDFNEESLARFIEDLISGE